MTAPSGDSQLPQLPRLPADFRFGTATSAYQIEGAVAEDGRGASVWDTFCAEPGRIADGTSGAVAADHYHHVDEDVRLLERLGADSYRFSIAWPRVQPSGCGPVNARGLDFYDRLVDKLLAIGVEPMATLFHWDLPQALEDDGGWLNRATVDRFADYAAVVGERLADRVAHWVPVNEPNTVTMLGYAMGTHAPGKLLGFDAMGVAHHLLLGHGRATIALRAAGATSVGCATSHGPVWPATDDDADVGASKLVDGIWNAMFAEPMLLGRYPTGLEMLVEHVLQDGDLATIRQPLDFYGVNYYLPFRIAAAAEDAPMPFELVEVVGRATTDVGWPVVPDALREWLITFRARLRAALPPIVLTESGCAYDDAPGPDGVVDDRARIDYHAAHIAAVSEAMRAGVDVRGYYLTSLLDSFSWAFGNSARFGIVHVDHETQRRTPKRSFEWYAELIAATRGSND